jgi:hypothetical protein
MIIVPRNPSPARSFLLLSAIQWISPRPDQQNGCLQTGKRCFTNRQRALRSAASFDCLESVAAAEFRCPLLGVKRTLIENAAMSAFDPKRTFPSANLTTSYAPV